MVDAGDKGDRGNRVDGGGGGERKEGEGENILTGGQKGQLKIVQEILADLKTFWQARPAHPRYVKNPKF